MPISRHSVALPSVKLPVEAKCGGVTELRVHGVGGSQPDAILGDLAPEQVMGDAIAGFYRSSDHRAGDGDRAAGLDADRHVEVYSWGGLTSRSKIRVLWLALLPFMFVNLAGWMCSASTRNSSWRFRLHRLAAGLGGLALTVNAVLVAVMISADVASYQTARADLARNQWWLAPLNWYYVKHHPGRQITFGVLVPVLLVLALVWLARKSWRYEAVRPPYRVAAKRKATARKITAATLKAGLADNDFWDGEGSVRVLTWLHVAVAGGFLAVVLGVTAKALTVTGAAQYLPLAWAGIAAGGATVVLGAAYICVDALGTPPVGTATGDAAAEDAPGGGAGDKLRGWLPGLLVPAAIALICSGVFAWLQPAGSAGPAAELPGMASVIGWTVLAIAVVLAIALISMLLGLPGSKGTLVGGPWVTLMLAFSVLNILMLAAQIWVAHLVGPVTSSETTALAHGQIYLPYVITSGLPLVVWAIVLTVLVFGLIEAIRWLLTRTLPAGTAKRYQDQAAAFRNLLAAPRKVWYWSGLKPFPPDDKIKDPGGGENWERQIARTQFLGRAPYDATWLLGGIIVGQLVMALCVWRLHVQPPAVIRDIGVLIAGLVLPALMAFLYAAWSDPTKRRTIGVLWDVGTFWPRSYHPLCPPCYAERAVPDLQRRMWWLHDNDGQVMLVGHSQGSVLATAALVQPGCRPRDDHAALITFGAPVCKLYSWGFPAYFNRALLWPLVPGQAARLNDWRNFYYPTDPIGGSVAADLPAAGDPVDTEFLDPAECYYVYGQAPPSSQGHSGYWADRRVWDVINGVAARLTGGPPPAPPGNGSALGAGPGDIPPKLGQKILQGPDATPAS